MSELSNLRINMLFVLLLTFAIGIAILYAILYVLGVRSYYALAVIAFFVVLDIYISPKLLFSYSKLRYIGPDEYPQLQEAIEVLSRKAGIPKPRIAIAPAQEPNIFTFGRTKRGATIAFHESLLPILSKEELYAAVWHEMGHIRHSDFIAMTLVSFIPLLAWGLTQDILWTETNGEPRRGNSYLFVFGILAFIVYFISGLLTLPLSKQRELYADGYAASMYKKPEYLASALYKLNIANLAVQNASRSSTSARAFYIIDFFTIDNDAKALRSHMSQVKELLPEADFSALSSSAAASRNGLLGMLSSLFSTHPPTYYRIIELLKIKKSGEPAA